MATRSRIRGLMCSTSNVIKRRFYDRDVSAALNIRCNAAGPGRPRELSSWLGRPDMLTQADQARIGWTCATRASCGSGSGGTSGFRVGGVVVNEAWLERKVNRGSLLHHAVDTSRQGEEARVSWQADWQAVGEQRNTRPYRPPFALTPGCSCKAHHIKLDNQAIHGLMRTAGMLPADVTCRHTTVYSHGNPKVLEKATACLNAHRVMAKKERKGTHLVDEPCTTRVSSAVNGQQPCEEELDHEQPTRPPTAPMKQPGSHTGSSLRARAQHSLASQAQQGTEAEPAAEPTQPTKGTGKAQGKAAKAKPAPQPGRWLDRDCNAALNMQRIGESRWRPLELCYWPDQGALPPKGKEYPGLGYKRLRDKPPKAQQQQPGEAQQCVPPPFELSSAVNQCMFFMPILHYSPNGSGKL
ncbi:hypothetical protein QJQ45_013296 [Haematococcus lacustris]|nr:hypothetical protein QJQ45_013296 [Haematococcus lacustris]